MDDFNSSDEEYGEPIKPHPKAGKKSIEKMMGSRFEDCRNTKKRMKNAAAVVGPVAVIVTTAVVTVVATIVLSRSFRCIKLKDKIRNASVLQYGL
jgi:hypothetical protein